jgi:hypothetical protein
VTTFCACSSPTPTRIKPEPAPAILSQESVHTMLSITHHTRKRPSTGPRTTHGPQLSGVGTLRKKVSHSRTKCLPKGSFHRDTIAASNYTICQWAQTTTMRRQPWPW